MYVSNTGKRTKSETDGGRVQERRKRTTTRTESNRERAELQKESTRRIPRQILRQTQSFLPSGLIPSSRRGPPDNSPLVLLDESSPKLNDLPSSKRARGGSSEMRSLAGKILRTFEDWLRLSRMRSIFLSSSLR